MDRVDRISEEVKKELSDIIRNEIRDPRMPDIISITQVRITKDLRYAKVFVSVLGDEQMKNDAIQALTHAAGFVRHAVGQRIKIHYTPEFTFKLDDSIEKGMYLSKLIDETVGHSNKPAEESSEED